MEMSAVSDANPGAIVEHGRKPTLFLSYASEDRAAAVALRDAMAAQGIDVWYDESELGGGEAWDQKIRRQIRECDFFMPVVSAQTEARLEGYFRREWRLAVERTQDMADDHLFLLPVVIDDTDQASARVPEKFLSVQWLKLPGGAGSAALAALCRRIASGDTLLPKPRKARSVAYGGASRPDYPPFPPVEGGHAARRLFAVLGWGLRCTWIAFRRLPKWIRIIATVWLVAALVERGCSSRHEPARDIPPATAQKLQKIAQDYQGGANKPDIVALGARIATEIAKDSGDTGSADAPLLAIPFSAPPGASAASKLANTTFATLYGRLSVARRGQVALAQEPLASNDLGAALERGKARHATYVLYGSIEPAGGVPTLGIHIASVDDRANLWSHSYAVTGSDPAGIAAEVEAKVPALGD
jgi:hypothetical protein